MVAPYAGRAATVRKRFLGGSTRLRALVMFLPFFAGIQLKARLGECFRHLRISKVFSRATIFLQLIVHILLG